MNEEKASRRERERDIGRARACVYVYAEDCS